MIARGVADADADAAVLAGLHARLDDAGRLLDAAARDITEGSHA